MCLVSNSLTRTSARFSEIEFFPDWKTISGITVGPIFSFSQFSLLTIRIWWGAFDQVELAGQKSILSRSHWVSQDIVLAVPFYRSCRITEVSSSCSCIYCPSWWFFLAEEHLPLKIKKKNILCFCELFCFCVCCCRYLKV